MQGTLQRILVEQQSFTRALFKRIEGVEDADSDWEVYRRRMGLRHYFKELKMNMTRIAKSKAARDPSESSTAKKKKKGKKATDAQSTVSSTFVAGDGESVKGLSPPE
jgi:hypothetical protein